MTTLTSKTLDISISLSRLYHCSSSSSWMDGGYNCSSELCFLLMLFLLCRGPTHSLSLSAQLNALVHPAPRHLGKSAGGKSPEIPLFIFHLIKQNRRVWDVLSRDSFPNFLEFIKKKALGTHIQVWSTHTRETFDCMSAESASEFPFYVMRPASWWNLSIVYSNFWNFSAEFIVIQQHWFYIIFKRSFKPLYRGKGSCFIILYFYCKKETWLKSFGKHVISLHI